MSLTGHLPVETDDDPSHRQGAAPADHLAEPEHTESKYERTRARILDAAARVLSARGYAGTRLSEVAEQAEVQAPAIYYYFPSRDALLGEVLACGLADMTVYLQQSLAALPAETSSLDRIMTAVAAHLRYELENFHYVTAFIRNANQVPSSVRMNQRHIEAGYGAIWRNLFDDAIAAKEVRADLDPRIAPMLILGALNWAVEWWDPTHAPTDAILHNAHSMIRSAIGPAATDIEVDVST